MPVTTKATLDIVSLLLVVEIRVPLNLLKSTSEPLRHNITQSYLDVYSSHSPLSVCRWPNVLRGLLLTTARQHFYVHIICHMKNNP